MKIHPFYDQIWEVRLALVLDALTEAQEPFLKVHWQANGLPTQITVYGRDETPYPSEDLARLYEAARLAKTGESAEYYMPLRTALDHVCDVMRLHPSLACASKTVFGDDGLQVSILNRSSFTSLTRIIVGQMVRHNSNSKKNFRGPIAELSSLLQLSRGGRSHSLSNHLDLCYDIALFHGAWVRDTVDLGEGYSLMPYSELCEYVDSEWLEDIAPEHLRHRHWEAVFAVVHQSRWEPEIRPPDSHDDRTVRGLPALFDRKISDFSNLLAVTTGAQVHWMMTFEGCVPRAASYLLGLIHGNISSRKGRSIGHLFDPFKKGQIVDLEAIEIARKHSFKRDCETSTELSPIILRLAEALRRDGRYASDDKVLDVAVSLERLFKPSGRSISMDLQNSIADFLGSSDELKAQLKDKVKHFYDVRSAIVHGPIDTKKRHLLTEVEEAFHNGFELARQTLLKKLEIEPL